MLKTMGQFRLQYSDHAQGKLGSLVATPSQLGKVIELQGQDVEILSIRDWVRLDIGDKGWTMHSNGSLRYKGQVVVPQSEVLREEILKEFHCSSFTIHPGVTKMYHDLRR